MTREEVLKDIRSRFGKVPKFLESIPDSSLEAEWQLLKQVELTERTLPSKYKQLIGLAISSSHGHPLRTLYHAKMAKAYGASDEEIKEVIEYAKFSNSWLVFFSGVEMGMGLDREQIKNDIMEIVNNIRSHVPVGV